MSIEVKVVADHPFELAEQLRAMADLLDTGVPGLQDTQPEEKSDADVEDKPKRTSKSRAKKKADDKAEEMAAGDGGDNAGEAGDGSGDGPDETDSEAPADEGKEADAGSPDKAFDQALNLLMEAYQDSKKKPKVMALLKEYEVSKFYDIDRSKGDQLLKQAKEIAGGD